MADACETAEAGVLDQLDLVLPEEVAPENDNSLDGGALVATACLGDDRIQAGHDWAVLEEEEDDDNSHVDDRRACGGHLSFRRPGDHPISRFVDFPVDASIVPGAFAPRRCCLLYRQL